MKGLGKMVVGFSLLTAALLLYVHERVEMLRVSYRIHEKTSALSEKAETYQRLKFEVAQLRSPQALERRLEELSIPLTLPKEIRVLRISAPAVSPSVEALPLSHPSGNFFDFLGQWIQIAQARTDQ